MTSPAGLLEQLKAMALADAPDLLKDPAFYFAAGSFVLLVLFLLVQPLLKKRSSAKAEEKAKPKKRELRGYTRAEVAQHKSENDLWLIIQNKGSDRLKVYDVTTYIEHHPGGDAIMWHAGDDCTQGFLGVQHPPTVFDLVEEYCIGWLEDP